MWINGQNQIANIFLEYAISPAGLSLNLGASRVCEASKKVFSHKFVSGGAKFCKKKTARSIEM